MESIIRIENIHKYFGEVHALRGVSLNVNKGEVVIIIGPSGSGKSTLLRCINRLEEYDEGVRSSPRLSARSLFGSGEKSVG